ncbi:MAG: SDR family oxidoreductase, partial [Clostridia bacterium]|nr:SDR family oxidoreductase [Clostridia bacterium]
FEMAKVFKKNGFNVVLSDVNKEELKLADAEIEKLEGKSGVLSLPCDVTSPDELNNLWNKAKEMFGGVDIWINNAGVNQPDKPVYELTPKEVEFLMNIDLKGSIFGCQVAFKGMKEQGYGQIYNVEGYGSNDAMMTGLTIYGTAKRAITYFTQALAKESEGLTGGKVCVCRLTPGIMITNFIKTANGGKTKIELPEKTKKVYNILGDYPETIANFVVPKMIKNKKNNKQIAWLTNRRAFGRFMTAGFKKRNFFD